MYPEFMPNTVEPNIPQPFDVPFMVSFLLDLTSYNRRLSSRNLKNEQSCAALS